VRVDVPTVAVNVAVDELFTGFVDTWNDTEDDPSGMVTVSGTWTFNEFDCNAATIPPEGAGRDRVNLAVELVPPVTVVGVSWNPAMV